MLIPDTSGKPPASGALHYNPVRNLRLLFRLVNVGLLLSELRSAQSPYTRHVPPTHRGTADGISTHGSPFIYRPRRHIERPVGQSGLFAPGASAYFLPPLHRRQLHYVSIHEATSGAVNLSGKGESVKATSPPLCKGSLRCARLATKRLATHSRTSSPGKSPFRRLTLHSVVVASTPGLAMPTQRPPHLDYTPAPRDARTDEVHTPLRLSVNRYTRSAFCRSRLTLPTPHTHFSRYSVPCARLKSVLLRRGCRKLL